MKEWVGSWAVGDVVDESELIDPNGGRFLSLMCTAGCLEGISSFFIFHQGEIGGTYFVGLNDQMSQKSFEIVQKIQDLTASRRFRILKTK